MPTKRENPETALSGAREQVEALEARMRQLEEDQEADRLLIENAQLEGDTDVDIPATVSRMRGRKEDMESVELELGVARRVLQQARVAASAAAFAELEEKIGAANKKFPKLADELTQCLRNLRDSAEAVESKREAWHVLERKAHRHANIAGIRKGGFGGDPPLPFGTRWDGEVLPAIRRLAEILERQ